MNFLLFKRKKIDKSRNKYDKLIETVSNEQNALKEFRDPSSCYSFFFYQQGQPMILQKKCTQI